MKTKLLRVSQLLDSFSLNWGQLVSSPTRCLNWLLNVWLFTTMKIYPIALKICPCRFKILAITKLTLTKNDADFRSIQSGEISPNLVTLLVRLFSNLFHENLNCASLSFQRIINLLPRWLTASFLIQICIFPLFGVVLILALSYHLLQC